MSKYPRIPCSYCGISYGSVNFVKHVATCYLNPKNLKKCKVCCKPIKNYKTTKGTCSYSCSNSFFRAGENNGNWNKDSYRSTCFLYHKKQCIICKESNIVAVHHYDNNHNNNLPANLVPLCPTHHSYVHSNFYHLIKKKVDKYVKTFKIGIVL